MKHRSSSASPIQRHIKLDSNGYEMLFQIEEDVLSEPPAVILQIVGSETPMPDLALSLYQTLSRRNREKTLLVTRALTSLTPPEALLWLCGDERDCLPSAGIIIPGMLEPADASQEWRQQADWGATEVISTTMRKWNSLVFTHQMPVLRREFSKFLELPESDTFLGPAQLLEWGLLGETFEPLLGHFGSQPDSVGEDIPPPMEPPQENPRRNLLG